MTLTLISLLILPPFVDIALCIRERRVDSAMHDRTWIMAAAAINIILSILAWNALAHHAADLFAAIFAETLEDLEEPRSASKIQRPKGSGPRRYQMDGFTFLVGRSPRQNDELIRKHSARDDLWCHVKDSPVAHVRLKTAGRSPEEAVVEAAEQLAAHYSSRAKESKVLVSFTSAQRVKKPAGAAPGLVIYSDELTLWVNPGARNANVLRCD